MEHKSGFVNIIGNPNVGKSTLMNALVGERMCIINKKPQTTRHRILGILNEEHYQIIFSDTPGIIDEPSYKMQDTMNKYAYSTFADADIMLLVIDSTEELELAEDLKRKLSGLKVPVFLVLNKVDLLKQREIDELKSWWGSQMKWDKLFTISAIQKEGTSTLLEEIINHLPEGHPYYPKDQLSDRPERFFVSEIIREKILNLYHQEIPYSSEVIIESFKEGVAKNGPIIFINANIYVSRKTQKSIIIGKGGSSIKQLGMDSRLAIEAFLDSRVHLELYVRVKDNWRNDERQLRNFGYH